MRKNSSWKMTFSRWMKTLGTAVGLFLSYVLLSANVAAQAVTYPIAELGSCRNARECYLYCEIKENKPACWSYGKYVLGPAVLGEHTSAEEEARAAGITFPVSELGNCASAAACMDYCNQPVNRNTCTDFARRNGLGKYREKTDLLETAKSELGCTDEASCRVVCEDPANHDRCMALAERVNPEMKQKRLQMLEKAQEFLGCDSFVSCKAICDNSANADKCASFAQNHMPEEYRAKHEEALQKAREHGLPCDSLESCRALCETDPASCQQFSDGQGRTEIHIHKEESFSCSSEEECQKACEANPDRCPGFDRGKEFLQERREGFDASQYETRSPQDYNTYDRGENYEGYDQDVPQEYQTQDSHRDYSESSSDTYTTPSYQDSATPSE